jgi:hypothetical protein
MPNLAAAPVFSGPALLAVALATPDAWLPAWVVLEAEALVCMLELAAAAAVELLGATDALAAALALADALADALAVALAPPLSKLAPSTTLAVMNDTSEPDRTAVCVSSPESSAVQVMTSLAVS